MSSNKEGRREEDSTKRNGNRRNTKSKLPSEGRGRREGRRKLIGRRRKAEGIWKEDTRTTGGRYEEERRRKEDTSKDEGSHLHCQCLHASV